MSNGSFIGGVLLVNALLGLGIFFLSMLWAFGYTSGYSNAIHCVTFHSLSASSYCINGDEGLIRITGAK